MTIATIFIYVFYTYLIMGIIFAILFVAKGVDKVDENMHGTNWKLRLLLIPGLALLWPIMLKKLAANQSEIRNRKSEIQ